MKTTKILENLIFLILITITLFTSLCKSYGQYKVKVKLSDVSATLNDVLPKDYTDRTFIKGLAMYRNKIEELVGCLIILEDNDKASIIGQYIEFNQPPVKNINLSDVLYSSKINSSASFNGSYMIASASATATSIVELILTDINGVLIPEKSIPYLEICKASKKVDSLIKKQIYYIRSVKLTNVHSKAYRKITSDTSLSGMVFNVGGKVYNSSDQFKNDYVVAVDMVSLNNLLLTKDCDEIITNNEVTARQLAQKAQQDAEKAETERKIKESELNAAKAEVNTLRFKLDEMEQTLKHNKDKIVLNYEMIINEINANLDIAQNRVVFANQEFKKAEDKSKKEVENSVTLKTKNETSEYLIQKANIPLISEVKKLSEEEISKLGFVKVE